MSVSIRETALADIARQIFKLEKNTLANLIETGRLILHAKSICPYGEWLQWIKNNFAWSDQTARRYVKVFKMSERVNLIGLNLSAGAAHFIVDLHASDNKDPAIKRILKHAETSRVTATIAKRIAAPPAVIEPPPPDPRIEAIIAAEPTNVSNTARKSIHSALYQLGKMVKHGVEVWEFEAQGLDPVKLRTIIDRLELIYQSRTASRFEDTA